MELRRLALERFGRLDGRDFRFGPGLNLIIGPNEAGKTTLREAILFALLGNPRHTTIDRQPHTSVDDHTTWGADRPFRLVLDFVDEARVEHRLVKDWSTVEASLTMGQTGVCIYDVESVQREMRSIVGCSSLKLFRSTACVAQDALEAVSDGAEEIGDQLQAIVTGGADEPNVSSVLNKLDDRISEMERGVRTSAPKHPGPIRVVQDKIAALDKRLSDVRSHVERAQEAARRLVELEAEIAATARTLEAKEALMVLSDQRAAWLAQRDEAGRAEAKLEETIDRARSAMAEIKEAAEALAKHGAVTAVDEESEHRLRRLHQRVIDLRESIEKRSVELQSLPSGQPTSEPANRRRLAGLIVAAALGLAGLGGGIATGVSGRWPLAIPVIGVGLALVVLALVRALGPARGASRAAFLAAEAASEREELERTSADLDAAVSAAGCETLEDLLTALGAARTLALKRDQAAIRRDALLENQTLDELISARKEQSRLRRDAEEALGEREMQRAADVDALRYEALVRDIEKAKTRLEDLQTDATACRTRVGDADETVDDVYALEERQSSLRERLDYLQERLAVYRVTRDAIAEARDQAMGSARDALNPRIATHVARLTGGRYEQARTDDDLNVHVFSAEKRDWVPADSHELSRGTVDQIYLAARLALLDLLYQDVAFPVLLDDPFGTFDAERRTHALTLCRQVAADRQVLLFTCYDGYVDAADHIVEMPGP